MTEPVARLYEILSATRGRLRRRGAVRGAVAGLWTGSCLALPVPVLTWLTGVPDAVGLGVIAALVALTTSLGATLGALGTRLSDRELALLADRVLGTDEVLVTAHGLDPSDPARATVLAAVVAATTPPPDWARALPARAPRHTRWAPLPIVVAVGLLLVPPRIWAPLPGAPVDREAQLQQEGEALAQRLEEIATEHPELPLPDAARELEALADALKRGALTEEEARTRLGEIASSLDRLDDETAAAEQLLEAVEQASRALEESETTESLAEALDRSDPAQMAEQAEKLAEKLGDPATAAQGAEALRQAGEQLAKSGDPAAQAAGDALKRAAEQAGDGLSAEEARELVESLEKVQDASEQASAQRDQAERLRGEAQRSASALGEEGQDGLGADGKAKGAARAGTGHTWEDGGDHAADPTHQDADRSSDRTSGKTADDFQALYKSVRRYEGAERVIAEADGELAKDGHIDEIEVRFTAGDESAGAPRVALPESYREEAAQAIAGEEIPPGYREAVKSYFEDPPR